MRIRKMLTGDLCRLRHVVRYSSIFTVHKESVAEHTFYVAMYSLILGEELRSSGTQISIGVLLTKALMHDVEEARTGDIYRPFKYASEELREMIEKHSADEVDYIMEQMEISDGSRKVLKLRWYDSKDDSVEGCVVAFADFLSVVSYMLQELNASNMTMLENHTTMFQYMNLFNDAKYDFMREHVQSVHDLLIEYFGNASPIKRIR